ncbi:MAG: zf-HC2 domain-containing protein [Chloroflexota bacterium]|nr:zf-HC2 domain-containing protein [Chloroflexota bacterium]
MKCAQCRPLLSKYVDGEALPTERTQVEAHIGGCSPCRALLAQYGLARSSVHNLPHYRPDPQGRTRLMAALNRQPRPADEVPITRRQGTAPLRHAAAPARRGGWLFGNLASGFAMLIVLAAVGLITGVLNGGANVSPTAGALNATRDASVIIVPTTIASIPVGQVVHAPPTGVPSIGAGGPKTLSASPTATFWTEEADTTAHWVRDEAYGYGLQYPSGWWTAAAAPVAGALAHRVLRPQPRRDGSRPGYSMTVDVLSNTTQLRDADLAHLDSPALPTALAGWQDGGATVSALTGLAAGVSGFSTVSGGSKGRRRVGYLLGGPLVYRLTMQEPAQANATDTAICDAAWTTVLQSFQLPRTPSIAPLGAAPLLFLHNGDLWALPGPDQALVRWTTDGRVRDFALSPAGNQVALLLGNDAGDPSANSIKLLSVADQTVSREIWHTLSIYTVAWLNDTNLLALGGSTVGEAPMGLYRIQADAMGSRQELLDWVGKTMPDPISSARNLRVSPDGGWISFQAGDNLYALGPDRRQVHSLLPNISRPPVVQDYAWLPPTDSESPTRLLLLTAGGLQTLHIGAPGSESEMGDLIQPSDRALAALAVAPNGHAAGLTRDGAALCLTKAPGTPTSGQMFNVPGVTDLRWCPTGLCLLYEQGSGTVAHLAAMDLSGRVILDQPMAPPP